MNNLVQFMSAINDLIQRLPTVSKTIVWSITAPNAVHYHRTCCYYGKLPTAPTMRVPRPTLVLRTLPPSKSLFELIWRLRLAKTHQMRQTQTHTPPGNKRYLYLAYMVVAVLTFPAEPPRWRETDVGIDQYKRSTGRNILQTEMKQ
jgi:hypothetical protein